MEGIQEYKKKIITSDPTDINILVFFHLQLEGNVYVKNKHSILEEEISVDEKKCLSLVNHTKIPQKS